ncbi:MAG TPA: hypothetical protein V6C89_01165 [Drouetiella sp.]|jgi:hypothetical protein
MDSESIKFAILTEAAKQGNHIYKIKSEGGDFIKLKHSYNQPEELRGRYLEALNALINSQYVKQVFVTDDIELYELTADGMSFTTLRSAMDQILSELENSGSVYKVHSDKGEYLQSGAKSHNKIDSERIVYLQALHMLLHHGAIRVSGESKEMATYQLDRTNQRYCDQTTQRERDVA